MKDLSYHTVAAMLRAPIKSHQNCTHDFSLDGSPRSKISNRASLDDHESKDVGEEHLKRPQTNQIIIPKISTQTIFSMQSKAMPTNRRDLRVPIQHQPNDIK